jgi:hypothetical protein
MFLGNWREIESREQDGLMVCGSRDVSLADLDAPPGVQHDIDDPALVAQGGCNLTLARRSQPAGQIRFYCRH